MYNLQKTSALGEDWARTDIVLSSPDEDKVLHLKFWGEQMDLVKSIRIGNTIIAYSMESNTYREKVELTSTDQTLIEVI